ncbi:ester hydrolase C11orf54-like isoform X2 [Lycorma delicatula]|uniref:ester hydrolase C11orf54-like isoform X2 n=1 Tax=Lycorma delicatula TaxID=130591 RepID=UPI003F515361
MSGGDQDKGQVLSKGLSSAFDFVDVKVVDCPNLTLEPFHLSSEGLSGSPRLIDFGGPPYLLPTVKRDKLYGFSKLGEVCGGIKQSFIIGAGAGPWPYAGTNCEMMANLKLTEDGKINNKTRIAKLLNVEKGEFTLEILPNSESRFALLGNFLLSEGKLGKVLKIHCKKRIGDDNFVTAIRSSLEKHYGSQPVGMGGVFILSQGKAKHHIMPDFSITPLKTEEDLNNWLFFYEMNAPIISVGTLISVDPGLDLRVQHFHSFNLNGEGGHYHYDTTPEIAEYTAYMTPAEFIYRVDKPTDTHNVGRD